MKSFAERNSFVVGAVGIGLTAAAVLASLNYDELPFVNQRTDYSAYFAEAGGLSSGAPVQISGDRVGQVSAVELEGPRVLVRFNIDNNVRLGDRTEAAIKTKTLLGSKVLEIIPRGPGQQSGAIPLDRTRPAYQLPDALGDLTATISGLNTDQLSDSLAVLSDTFKDTPPQLKVAVEGVARFSETLNTRDEQLRNLLADANKASSVLAQRTDQVVGLIANTNALLDQLRSQSKALARISSSVSVLARQIKGFISEDRVVLKPALDKLNGVLTMVDNRKERLQEAIAKISPFAMSLGESVSSGPFFKAYLVNLLPGQFVQPFIDAAFSDLGLDPRVLLPSDREDPQVGQPGTPPLPLPFPRTGQGGAPLQNLPDAITGKPDDPRYPYRQPPPAPPPGGPPPGPPPLLPPDERYTLSPTPNPTLVPAPGEAAPSRAPAGPAPAGGGQ